MTENKRFTINTLDGSVDLRDNGKVMTYKQTVEILNNLSEENEQLKDKLHVNILLTDDERRKYDKYIKKLEKENEQLKNENENLKSNVDNLMNMELEDIDIVCQAGKFRLEEWGKHRLHQFYEGDTPLEDVSVVIMLLDLTKENEQLKNENQRLLERSHHEIASNNGLVR